MSLRWTTLAALAGLAGMQDGVRCGPTDDAPTAAIRAQAETLHRLHAATLETIHHHFFRRENPVLPARAMEEMFAKLERQTKVRARWIAVNAKAMSIEHEPKTDFDRKAAAALAAGKESYEAVVNGFYHRAGPIPLGGACIACHAPPSFTGKGPAGPFVAGLVISIPLSKP